MLWLAKAPQNFPAMIFLRGSIFLRLKARREREGDLRLAVNLTPFIFSVRILPCVRGVGNGEAGPETREDEQQSRLDRGERQEQDYSLTKPASQGQGGQAQVSLGSGKE